MTIEIDYADEEDYDKLILLLKENFKKHNIFTKEDKIILDYMKNAEGDFLIAKDEDEVVGCLMLDSEDNEEGHSLWRIKHIAVTKGKRKLGVDKVLMDEVDSIIRGKIEKKEFETAKLEIHVSENEKDNISIFKKLGYSVEGKLTDHYRAGEICYVLGKSL